MLISVVYAICFPCCVNARLMLSSCGACPTKPSRTFRRPGLFRALQPKRYGGYELDPDIFYQAVIEVGTVCGSSAWILGVIGVHNWHLAIFPPQAQEDVWARIRASSSRHR